MKNNYTTTTTEAKMPVWMLALDFIEEPELVEAKRDSDGRYLRRNVNLNVKPVAKFADDLAGRSDYDGTDCLFAARR